MIVTRHAKHRLRQIKGKNVKDYDSYANKAFQRGTKFTDTEGELRVFLERYKCDLLKLYNHCIYIFRYDEEADDIKLITVIRLQKRFYKNEDSLKGKLKTFKRAWFNKRR